MSGHDTGGASRPFLVDAPVTRVKRLASDVFELWLEAPDIAEAASPGQFVQLHLGRDAYGSIQTLRRPFSIAGARDGAVRLVFRVAGRVTGRMARLESGDTVSLLGPLGRGFAAAGLPEEGKVLAVAGGVGVAPLLFLVEREAAARPINLIWGVRTVDDAWYEDAFLDLAGFLLATEDGSSRYAGRAADYLLVTERLFAPDAFVLVGPHPMLEAGTRALASGGRRVFVSLETYMGCGIGACCSCLVRGRTRWFKACEDGPVFDAKEVLWQWQER